MQEAQTTALQWRLSPHGRCWVAEVNGYASLVGTTHRGTAWWVTQTAPRFSRAQPRVVAKGSAPTVGEAQRAAEQAVPCDLRSADEWRARAADRNAWRPSTSGACLVRVERGYGLLVGHDWWQVRDLEWTYNRPHPGERVIYGGKANTLEEAMVAAFRYAHPAPLPPEPPAPAPIASEPVAPPYARPTAKRRTPGERAEAGRGYLAYLHRQIAALEAARRVPTTNGEMQAELMAAVEHAESMVRCTQADLAKCRALPDHWPSKAGRVEAAEVQLAIEEAKLAIARIKARHS